MNNKSILSILDEIQRERRSSQRNVLMQSSLHIGQPAVLLYVLEHPGCSQKQIADETRVTPASVATTLKRLEKNGLIYRRSDTADTRCNRVYITEAGESELDYCCKELESIDRVLIDALSDIERAAVYSGIEKMIEGIKQHRKK